MKPVYAIVNPEEREKFEKEWFVSYGYADCELFDNLEDAIEEYEKNWYDDAYRERHIIERIDSEGREIVYWS